MLSLERVALADVPWHELDAYPGRTVFQSKAWLEFLVATQAAEPVVIRIERNGERVGWFTGAVVTRLGIRILGSPFQGWTTGPMGFNLSDGIDHAEAVASLLKFAYGPLRCLHVELMDRDLGFDHVAEVGGEVATFQTFEVDLNREPEEIFSGMSSACRRAVRKSQKSGVTVEIASDEAFAEEYYAQLEDVFAKQSLTPPYGVDRVRKLIRHLGEDRLLLLRARNPASQSIATGIFPFHGTGAFFWGGASWRRHQSLRPNEALFWRAMQELRERGVSHLDLGGGGDYKRKYGVSEVTRPFLRRARIPALLKLRNVAADVVWRWRTRRGGGRPA